MTYENAPATKLVATHCACCARPLVDAESLSWGIGPVCRKKHGLTLKKLGPEVHKQANVTLFKIAALFPTDLPTALVLTEGLRSLAPSLEHVCDKILARACSVVITSDGDWTLLDTAYSPELPGKFKAVGGRWRPEKKVWAFPATRRVDVFKMLLATFAGQYAMTPSGAVWRIPTLEEAKQQKAAKAA